MPRTGFFWFSSHEGILPFINIKNGKILLPDGSERTNYIWRVERPDKSIVIVKSPYSPVELATGEENHYYVKAGYRTIRHGYGLFVWLTPLRTSLDQEPDLHTALVLAGTVLSTAVKSVVATDSEAEAELKKIAVQAFGDLPDWW